ncbi:MAG TPA: DegV family protein [Anaerolineales bacterium]|jgi:DegV family protein with EDD domain
MKIGIVTDSTCDLPARDVETHAIEVIPSILIIDAQEYADGQGLSREEFYRRLPEFKRAPTTAAPSIGEFLARYQKLLTAGCEHILSIHAASQLTAIFSTAQQAAEDFPGRVTCIDSGSLSLGLGFQALAAAEAAEDGFQAALQAVESVRASVRVFAALDTMEYLRRSGRVPAAITLLGGALSLKPLVELAGGRIKPAGAARTTRQADERLLQLLLDSGKLARLAILHTGAEPRARAFLNELMMRASQAVPREVLLVNVTTVIGTHVGPNGLGFAAVPA